ncbi:MAG: Rpp14/Pop5 family protein [Candidatus Bathyarchaeia archaeon]
MYPKRIKRRYIAFRILGEGTFTFREIMEAIQGELLRLYGEHGVAKANLQSIEFDEKNLLGILRCERSSLMEVRAALTALMEISGRPVALHCLGISGTLKSLRRKFLRNPSG